MKDPGPSLEGAQNPQAGTDEGALSPEELLAHLDAGTLDPAGFHHAHHVAASWAALREPGAERRICRGLRALAERAHVPERYDEQLTLSFLRLIEDRLRKAPDAPWPAFRAQFPELFDRHRAQACMRELQPPSEDRHPQRKRRG
jgi:hypothetical protein